MAKLGKQNLSIAHQRQKYVSKLTTRSNLSYPTFKSFNISQFSRFSWFNGPMFGSPKQLKWNSPRHFPLRKTRETPFSPGPPKRPRCWDSHTDSWICCKEGPPLGGGAAGAALGAAGAGAMAIGWPAGWMGWLEFSFPCQLWPFSDTTPVPFEKIKRSNFLKKMDLVIQSDLFILVRGHFTLEKVT